MGGSLFIASCLSDFARGDKRKIERLKESQILKSSQVFTVADFIDKAECDIEDIFHTDVFSEILNGTYLLKGDDQVDTYKLTSSTPTTERIVKQTENLFKVMSVGVPEFDHFTPSSWLIKNLEVFDVENEAVLTTLDIAENIFKTFNALLKE